METFPSPNLVLQSFHQIFKARSAVEFSLMPEDTFHITSHHSRKHFYHLLVRPHFEEENLGNNNISKLI